MVHREFLFSWTDMILHSLSNGFKIEFITSDKIYIDLNRELLADITKDYDADYHFWVDADQTYPKDTIVKLAKHIDDGHLVVTGMTCDKENGKHLGYTFEPGSRLFSGVEKTPLKTNNGLQKIDCMGFGGVMMSPEVLNKLTKPYFLFMREETIFRDVAHIGEDFAFYWKCKRNVIDVWCDTDLQFGHLRTETVYSCDR